MPEQSINPDDTAADQAAVDEAKSKTTVVDDSKASDGTPSTEWRDQVQKATGIDLSKYADDDAAKRGLAQMNQMVGQKDQDAENYRQLGATLEASGHTAEDIDAFLKGEIPTQQVEAAKTDVALPKSYDEYRLLASKVLDANGERNPKADPTDWKSYVDATERMQRAAFDQSVNGAPETGMSKKEVTAQLVAQQDEAAQNAIYDKNRELIWNDGDNASGLTKTGEAIQDQWQKMLDAGAGKTAKTLSLAIENVQKTIPKPKKTQTPGSQATRKAGVAPKKSTTQENDETLRKNGLRGLYEQKNAAAEAGA